MPMIMMITIPLMMAVVLRRAVNGSNDYVERKGKDHRCSDADEFLGSFNMLMMMGMAE